MDCTICLDEKIHSENIKHLDCGHQICKDCYYKLVRNLCPFCRCIIVNKVDGSYNINYDDMISDDFINNIYDSEYQIDNILPQSNLNNNYDLYSTYYTNESHESIIHNKRKSKKKKNNRMSNSFRCNKEKESWERKSRKNKKKRRVYEF